jgi:hypothetical protein
VIRLAPYAVLIAIGAFAVWYVMDLRATVVAQEQEIASMELLLGACEARADNIDQDRETDDKIDSLTDDDLRLVPNRWLFPAPGGPGSL